MTSSVLCLLLLACAVTITAGQHQSNLPPGTVRSTFVPTLNTEDGTLKMTGTDVQMNRVDFTNNVMITVTMADFEQLFVRVSTLEASVSALQTANAALQAANSVLNATLTQTQGRVSLLENTLSTTRSELASTQTSLNSTQVTLAATQSALSTAQAALTSTQGSLATTQSTLADTQGRVTAVETRSAATNGSVVALAVRVSAIEATYATASSVAALSTQATALSTDLATTNSQLTQATGALMGNITQANSQISSVGTTLATTVQRVTTLEQQGQTRDNNITQLASVQAQNTRSILSLTNDTTAIRADLLAHNMTLGLLGSNQTTLSAALQTQITALGTRVAAVEALDPRVAAAETNIITLRANVTAVQSSIAGLTTTVNSKATAQSVTDLTATVTTLQATSATNVSVNALTGRVAAIESSYATTAALGAVQTTATTLDTKITTVNSTCTTGIQTVQSSLTSFSVNTNTTLGGINNSIVLLNQTKANVLDVTLQFAAQSSSISTQISNQIGVSESRTYANFTAALSSQQTTLITPLANRVTNLENTYVTRASADNTTNAILVQIGSVAASISSLNVSNSPVIRCLDLGLVYSATRNRCEPASTRVLCPAAVPVASSSSVCTGTAFDSTCTVTCNSGYSGGVRSYWCDPFGVWQTLNTTTLTCTDINECLANNGGCMDVCTNTPGSFACTCPQGILKADGRNCEQMTVTIVTTTANIRTTCSGNVQQTLALPATVPPIPSNATAIIVAVTSYDSNGNDHVVHSFGRFSNHAAYTYDNQPYNLNTYLNDMMFTHNGDSAGNYPYGDSKGTMILPIANSQILAQVCMGWSRGTHYIVLQVIGFIQGDGILPTNLVNNQRAILTTPNSFITFVPGNVPSSALATIGNWNTWIGQSDHFNNFLGRDASLVDTYDWDNRPYDLNTYLDDCYFTYEGDNGPNMAYGMSYGSFMIPSRNGNMNTRLGNGKNDNNPAYFTYQVTGYVPPGYSNVKLLSTSPMQVNNVRFQFVNPVSKTDFTPLNVPIGAKAILANVYIHGATVSDHFVCTFGRSAAANANYGIDVYNNNAYQNDVILTYQGDGAPNYYYGHAFGPQIIPLKSDGKFEGNLGNGKNSGSTQTISITIQVFGYIQ